ncbi:hypothetical protein GC102_10195 [Paenibacillus sp. LMG 31460]|uniref:Uncharacterized protein n=1 Tax=Paenibacillus germinis TaxID=2654979 RepID=A0ABX1YYD0_9BACL|nr:hypothetical protein [Paenibacillus germinis]NOU86145.1 hypothetical protein [Paenibacillus germinis]
MSAGWAYLFVAGHLGRRNLAIVKKGRSTATLKKFDEFDSEWQFVLGSSEIVDTKYRHNSWEVIVFSWYLVFRLIWGMRGRKLLYGVQQFLSFRLS